MGDLSKLLNDIIEEDESLQKEIELLELKYKIIDELIKFRKSYKLSQSEFANMIDVKQQMISRFEKGEVDPRLSFISKILLGMKKDVIIRDKDYINVSNNINFNKRKKAVYIPSNYKLVG